MAMILVVDDECGIREFLADVLAGAGHEVAQAADADEALRRLEDRPYDLVVLDLDMPGGRGGLDVLRRVRAEWPRTQTVVLTAHGTVETAVEAMRLGAFDFLQKPIAGPPELRRMADRALSWRGVPTTPATAAVDHPVRPSGRSGVLGGFLWELKRRHVYNVSATYAAICFILLQSAELVLPVLPLPPAAYTVMVAVVIAGFPVAVVLGWLYDLTAFGWRRGSRAPGWAASPSVAHSSVEKP